MKRLPLLALALALAAPLHAQVEAPKAEATMTAAAGLEVKLWASEPLFVNPTCMDVDHKGRVWVVESVNYRNRLRRLPKLNRAAGDRIVILEDTKGAGKADKATTFYQSPDIMAPLGLAVAKDPQGAGYRVFVCQSPDILVIEDADGDGKADGPPRKLLTGFRGVDHDHGVHGVLIGPDMKLYFSVGDSGVDGLRSSDGKGRVWKSNDTDCRAGTVWRCDLDGRNLELIAHNFRNEYEPCVDSFGNVFVSDNDDDGNQQTRICHVIPGGNYGYHATGRKVSHWNEELPGVMPKILRTYFGSPTGICVYEGGLLPAKYRGQLLHTDAGPRELRCYHLTPRGASYAAEQERLLTSTDGWFRPSDVCVAPDGALFVADWYDPGVGGHGMGDTTRGRIYRVAPKGHAPRVPKVDLATDKGVLAALGSPNLAVRYMAMARLGTMKADEAIKLLGPAAAQKADAVLRARALWQIARLGGPKARGNKAVRAAFNDADPRFQVLAIRLAKDHLGYSTADLVTYLTGLVRLKGADGAVRREALVALRGGPPALVKKLLYELMGRYDGKDRHYLACVGIAVGHHDAKRREALLADFAGHFTGWDDKVAGLVWELRPPKILPLLKKRITDEKVPAGQRAKIVDVLAGSEDAKAGEAVLGLLQSDLPEEVRGRAVEHLTLYLPNRWQGLRKLPALDNAVTNLLGEGKGKASAVALIAAAGRVDRVKDVLAVASEEKEGLEARRAAVRALGELPGEASVRGLSALAAKGVMQGEAVAALGEQARRAPRGAKQPAAAVKALQGLLASSQGDAAQAERVVAALAAGRSGTVWLIEQHRGGKLDAKLVATAGRLLRNSPYQDLRNRAMLAFPAPGRLNPKKLPSVAVLAARKGDAARGKRVLAASLKGDAQCLKCHAVRGVGGAVGPDLSMIGKKASRENLFESILQPSKAIADQYLTWTVETKQGLTISGLIVEDGPNGVVVRDAEGRDTRVAKNQVESRKKGAVSLMPEDVVAALTEDDLVDMVEYLLTLRTASLGVAEWDVVGPFDNGSGMAGLDKEFGPEKGVDLKATYAGKHGKVGWAAVKAGPGGYVDLAARYGKRSGQTVSYLTVEVESPAEQEGTVLLGTDDGAKVWVNGKLVHTARVTRAAAPEQDTVRVRLRKGANRVLVKINNGDGPHGLFFTLLTEQEVKAARKP